MIPPFQNFIEKRALISQRPLSTISSNNKSTPLSEISKNDSEVLNYPPSFKKKEVLIEEGPPIPSIITNQSFPHHMTKMEPCSPPKYSKKGLDAFNNLSSHDITKKDTLMRADPSLTIPSIIPNQLPPHHMVEREFLIKSGSPSFPMAKKLNTKLLPLPIPSNFVHRSQSKLSHFRYKWVFYTCKGSHVLFHVSKPSGPL